jgi:micrococcal nuclease
MTRLGLRPACKPFIPFKFHVVVVGMLFSSLSIAQPAVVTHITDGDTLWVRPVSGVGVGVGSNVSHPKQRPIKLRLQGIDAPERCQVWGPQATAALAGKVLNKEVRLQTRSRDDHQRVLGNVWLGDEDVSAWMVAQGHAWSYRYRTSVGPYAAQERQARQGRLGLFADPTAMEPRQFRKSNGPCPPKA